jgi:hypothetical protein
MLILVNYLKLGRKKSLKYLYMILNPEISLVNGKAHPLKCAMAPRGINKTAEFFDLLMSKITALRKA